MRTRLADELAETAEVWARSQHRIVELAARFADSGEWAFEGFATAAHWIASVADIEVCTGREWIRIGKALIELPATAEAFAKGRLSYSKVRTLTRVAAPENEAELCALAERVPAGRLGQTLAAWANRNEDPETIAARQHEARSITYRVEPDGMIVTTIRQPPVDGALLHARLERIVMSGKVTPRRDRSTGCSENASAGGRFDPSDRWPSMAQQRADALVYLLNSVDGGGSGPGPDVELVVHVRGDGCTLDDGTPVPDSTVAKLIPTSLIRVLIHDADANPINASKRRRYPTTRQKRLVKERDRGCVDCGTDHYLEYDHVPAWEQSRQTVVEELQVRCSGCHRRRHAHH